MGYNYYRKLGEQEEDLTNPEVIDSIIKYNVIPTLASGTLLFCFTMFWTMFVPFDFVSYILSFVGYFVLLILTLTVANRGKNSPAIMLFYGLCFVSGFMQRPVLLFALAYLGSFADVVLLFSIAVVSATAVIGFIWFFTRTSTAMYKPGSGFQRSGIWIGSFFLIGLSIWSIGSLILGAWDWYLLLSSLVSVALVGLYTIYDMKALRFRVASGRWMYATTSLAINYFVLIVRIFLIMVIGSGRRR